MIVKNPKHMADIEKKVTPDENGGEGKTNPHNEVQEEYNSRTENIETGKHHNQEDGVRGGKCSGQGRHGSHYSRQGD